MKNKNLSLIGCGWLGHDLALELTSLGFSVIGTTSGKKTSSYLPLNLLENPIVPDVILNSDVLIYMIPPVEISFIKNFFNQIPENKKIIFIMLQS